MFKKVVHFFEVINQNNEIGNAFSFSVKIMAISIFTVLCFAGIICIMSMITRDYTFIEQAFNFVLALKK
jgi:hypothetical protein